MRGIGVFHAHKKTQVMFCRRTAYRSFFGFDHEMVCLDVLVDRDGKPTNGSELDGDEDRIGIAADGYVLLRWNATVNRPRGGCVVGNGQRSLDDRAIRPIAPNRGPRRIGEKVVFEGVHAIHHVTRRSHGVRPESDVDRNEVHGLKSTAYDGHAAGGIERGR